MTYPHIEQESKTIKLDVPDYLTPEHQKEVMDINNAVMKTVLLCGPARDCLNCGNEDCMKIFERQAKLWGMSLHDMLKQLREQQEEDIKAVEAMKRRYAEYAKQAEEIKRTVFEKIHRREAVEETGLFDMGRAALRLK